MQELKERGSIDLQDIAEKLCCAALCGKAAEWPAHCEPMLSPILLETAQAHGVDMLLNRALQGHPDAHTWPDSVRQGLRSRHYLFSAEEMLTAAELRKLLDIFGAAGIRPLLMKGAALAYSHYPESSCRPRCDSDLLFAAEQMPEVKKLLDSCGYIFPNAVSGEWVSSQQVAYRPLSGSIGCVLDLHWKINNMPLLGDAFDYAAALAKAHTLPALGDNAFALCSVHALLLACMHRAGHLRETFLLHGKSVSQGNRLIWLYDMHLLSAAMTEAESDEFIALAQEYKMAAICRDALERMQQYFPVRNAVSLIAALAANQETEPSVSYLSGASRNRLANTLHDIALVSNFAGRAKLLREHLFPPADYMLRKYHCRQHYCLPFLYIWRILTGFGKAIRH